jgi:LPS-assembly protein
VPHCFSLSMAASRGAAMVCALMCCIAQAADGGSPALQPSTLLTFPGWSSQASTRSQTASNTAPTASPPLFLSADTLDGFADWVTISHGRSQLRRAGLMLDADQLRYWSIDDVADAQGRVRLVHADDQLRGPRIRLNFLDDTGVIDQPDYRMIRRKTVQGGTLVDAPSRAELTRTIISTGHAQRADLLGESRYLLHEGTYTTCTADSPDWLIRARKLELDYARETARGEDATLAFLGVPIFGSPWLSFPLTEGRRSGFLTPTIGASSNAGTEISIPWYWNIAPNYDATITPRWMLTRGVQLNAQARYLTENTSGTTTVSYLPQDRKTGQSRHAYSIRHAQTLPHGFSGSIDLNGVSDHDYFKDLGATGASGSSVAAVTTQLRQGTLSTSGAWWNATLTAQRYQVIQDKDNPVVEPYRLMPRLSWSASRQDLPLSSIVDVNGELTRFDHPTLVQGLRLFWYPQWSLPLQGAWFEITPKVGLHVRQYDLERNTPDTPSRQTMTIPVVSVDAKVYLERGLDWFGHEATQTLEPRLYYLHVPSRDQSQIPVFDTGQSDFNFAQIFSDNRYSGQDRLGDAHQLTAAMTSRLLDPQTGEERLRATLAQRYYFRDQEVTLPNEVPRTDRFADVLAALSGIILPKTYLDTAVQYTPQSGRAQRYSVGLRYQPEPGRVLSVGYRYQRDVLDQIDMAGQWPLWGRWYGIGRYNYSFREKLQNGSMGGRLLEALAGLEYDGGCWAARFVVRRLVTSLGSASHSFFLQLELNGIGALGTDPKGLINRSVPGYWRVDQLPDAQPSAMGHAPGMPAGLEGQESDALTLPSDDLLEPPPSFVGQH